MARRNKGQSGNPTGRPRNGLAIAELARKEVEKRKLVAGHPDVEGLCLALADWSAELRMLQNEKRRRAETRRREGCGDVEAQPFTE
jgi:hypothetical protein